jgi:tetratricopeptide (TPR) repeat protein
MSMARLLEELALEPPASLNPQQRRYPAGQVDSLGSAFVGRADLLWQLDFSLRFDSAFGGQRIIALHGGGGAGKTRLALEYLHRYGSHYPGGIFWVDADVSPERLEEQLHGILRTLQPETPDLPLFRKQQRRAADELAQALQAIPGEQRILYVVDNVPEPASSQRPSPLRTWCPVPGRVSLLITSRLVIMEQGVSPIRVEPLAPDSAVTMLTRGVMAPALEQQDWERITHWVGQLPLALELLNSALGLGAIAPEELLEKARNTRPAVELDQQMEAIRPQVTSESLRGITEAFSLSYERLPEAAKKAARLVALLAPEPIPLRVLKALGPEAFAHAQRSALLGRSFVSPVPEREIHLFGRMHRVLADFLRSQTRDSSELLHVGRALRELIPPEACRDPAEWPFLQLWFPHAEAVHAAFQQQVVTLDASLEANLGLLMAYFLAERGALAQARHAGMEVLERVQAAVGPEHPDTLAAMGNLALTLRELGDNASAISLGESLLPICRRVCGDDDQRTLVIMGNLAAALHAEGLLQQALVLKEEVLEHRQRVLGRDHLETLTAMNNLAQLLADLGDMDRAFELQEETLRSSLEVLGPEHTDTLVALINLARLHCARGELEVALEMQEAALAQFQKSHGPRHPKTLAAPESLGGTLLAAGHHARAQRLMGELLGAEAPEIRPAVPEPRRGMSFAEFKSNPTAAMSKADLQLLLVGAAVEGAVFEQIRSFLLGKLLSLGIRHGEAAAVIERGPKKYKVRLRLRWADASKEIGTITVPLRGYDEEGFELAARKAGITELDDPELFIVTLRDFNSGKG